MISLRPAWSCFTPCIPVEDGRSVMDSQIPYPGFQCLHFSQIAASQENARESKTDDIMSILQVRPKKKSKGLFVFLVWRNAVSCLCALLSMQNPRVGLILVLEGLYFMHYIWLKCLLGIVTIYSDILFHHFCLKIQNWEFKKKKKADPYFPIFWIGRKRVDFFFFFEA